MEIQNFSKRVETKSFCFRGGVLFHGIFCAWSRGMFLPFPADFGELQDPGSGGRRLVVVASAGIVLGAGEEALEACAFSLAPTDELDAAFPSGLFWPIGSSFGGGYYVYPPGVKTLGLFLGIGASSGLVSEPRDPCAFCLWKSGFGRAWLNTWTSCSGRT